MGQILKFPVRAAKFGYKRVPKRNKSIENPAQLQLFPQPTAQILQLGSGLSSFEYALLLDEKGDPRAADFYLRAITEQDCVADAYCNLGIMESKGGRATKALDHFTNSLKHNPRHSEAHYNSGNVYFELEDFRLAQLHYELAAEFDPSFPNVFFNLALVLSITEQLDAAVSALTRYQQLTPPNEARKADELLDKLKKSLAVHKPSRIGGSK
jgi:tetratricopeptide (TPR) repeat protein